MSNKLTESLKIALADSYALYLKTQNYHWNVTGSAFQALHTLFQTQYEELALAIDEIAERIRTLGELSPGGFAIYQKLTNIKDAKEDKISSNEMLEDLINSYSIVISSFKNVVSLSQEKGDDVTQDLGISRIEVMEKNLWMLKSSL